MMIHLRPQGGYLAPTPEEGSFKGCAASAEFVLVLFWRAEKRNDLDFRLT